MMRARDALSEFLEALAQPQNYDVVWDAAKGEALRGICRSSRLTRPPRRQRQGKRQPAAHPLA